jgi:large subunit ribosomal protein L25
MRKDITINAEPRQERGKNEARRLRVKGSIPAVVYGGKDGSVAISVDPKEVNRILHSKTGHNTIFDVAIRDMATTPVMVVDWQKDPVKGNLLHVDLKRIDLSQRLLVMIPVYCSGEAKGVKQEGGLLEVVTREIQVECLPDEIPESFAVDVTELMLGESKRASDLPLIGSMKLISQPEMVLVHVVAMRVEVEETPAVVEGAEVAASPAEPEVIKKGKKEAEEGEGAEAAPAPEKEKEKEKEKKK